MKKFKKFFKLAICVMALVFTGCNPNTSSTSNYKAKPFSISSSKQVYFSSGNLQYHPVNNEWRFAEDQLDYIGEANVNCSSTYNGWLDLFGSNTSVHFGVSTSTNYRDCNVLFVDWGTNQIGNDAPNTWRTLTWDEWDYVVFDRPNASSLRGVVQVNGVNGLVLLPDNWVCPSGVTFKPGVHSEYSAEAYGQYQTFTAEQWSKLEAAGAVFFPAAGGRDGSNVLVVQELGYYWSAPYHNYYQADYLSFNSGEVAIQRDIRYFGFSVRLVKDIAPKEPDSSAGVQHYVNSTDSNVAKVDSINMVESEELDSSAGVQHYINSSDSNVIKVDSLNMVAIEEPNISVAIGVFSVSMDKQVAFSKGKLQYTQSTNTWSFAENQYDAIGSATVSNCALADKMDLFGWSGNNTTAPFGVSTSKNYPDYSGSFVDWGTNKIGNDAPNTWRTLSRDEWIYLIKTRTNNDSLRGLAQVAGIKGWILLPDNWVAPVGINFESDKSWSRRIFELDQFSTSDELSPSEELLKLQKQKQHINKRLREIEKMDFTDLYQSFTAEQWSKMEQAGAVFLPWGYYWLSTDHGNDGLNAMIATCDKNTPSYTCTHRFHGQAVRLVKDL